jgi:hypothetical protein
MVPAQALKTTIVKVLKKKVILKRRTTLGKKTFRSTTLASKDLCYKTFYGRNLFHTLVS